MGSGKTTVGRIVADALGCPFADLDELVVAREHSSVISSEDSSVIPSEVEESPGTIADIFATKGEEYFRRAEEQALAAVLKKYAQGNLVLALGGGTILSARSRALLQRDTLCIWLDAPAEVLWSRISGDSSTALGMTGVVAGLTGVGAKTGAGMTGAIAARPLADADFATRLESRRPLYAEAAHVTIDTSGLSPEEISDEIIISCL
jgi:shikimate kinase